jgi:hypothetical protein
MAELASPDCFESWKQAVVRVFDRMAANPDKYKMQTNEQFSHLITAKFCLNSSENILV